MALSQKAFLFGSNLQKGCFDHHQPKEKMPRTLISYLAPIFGGLAFEEQNITEDEEDFFEDEGTKIRGCYLIFLGVSRQFCLKT